MAKNTLRQHPLYRRWTRICSALNNPKDTDHNLVLRYNLQCAWSTARSFCEDVEAEIGLPPDKSRFYLCRKDPTIGWVPGNLFWGNGNERGTRQVNTIILTYKGEKHNLREWSRITGINAATIYERLYGDKKVAKAWTVAQALGYKPPPKRTAPWKKAGAKISQ